VAAQESPRARLFVGYSGWSEGQLEAELEFGGWLTAAARAEHVFGPPDQLWDDTFRAITREKHHPDVDPRFIPDDPSVN
jgi:putative transcriptional regulator